MFYLLIICNLVIAGSTVLTYRSLPPQIPLNYSKQTGEDQLAEWWMIFILPILMNIIFIINAYLLKKVFPGNKFIRQLLYYANLIIILGFTSIFLKIILLIT